MPDDPAPIRGRWTILWPDNCERWTVTVADGHDPHDEAGWKHIPVVPIPDEAAIERAARHMAEARWATWLHPLTWDGITERSRDQWRAVALAVLRAALEGGQ